MTEDGTKSLDDLITVIERGALDDLSIIKSAPAGDSIDSGVAVRLIAHLTVRTAHVRTTFQRATNQIVDEIGALFSDPSRVREYLRVDDSGTNTISARITGELMNPIAAQRPFRRLRRAFRYRRSDLKIDQRRLNRFRRSCYRGQHLVLSGDNAQRRRRR